MKLFIYEFYTSGTVNGNEELKKSGFAMIDAILKDFSRIPGLKITTMMDSSLKDELGATPYYQEIYIHWTVEEKDVLVQFTEMLSTCDLVLVIAPETDRQLPRLTALAENCGKKVLGSSYRAVELAGNKAAVLDILKKQGIKVPRTEILTLTKYIYQKDKSKYLRDEILAKFPFPLVIKPVHGTGGEGVWLVEDYTQLDRVLHSFATLNQEAMLVQEYIAGEAVSVSCFVYNGRVLPLSLNRQIINTQGELCFRGITIPYEHDSTQEILLSTTKACKAVNELCGFVGVDLVVSDQGPVIMEINARITMAYVALREITSRNLAQDLLSLCLEGRFPERAQLTGTYTYMLQQP